MRCREKACAFPALRDSLCVFHLRDRDETSSRSKIYEREATKEELEQRERSTDHGLDRKPRGINRKIARIQWSQVQKDRDSGMSLKDLAEKYKVSITTIQFRTYRTEASTRSAVIRRGFAQ